MKKVLLASLIGLVSTHALAQDEIKFVMEATYPPFEYMDETTKSKALTLILLMRFVLRCRQNVLSITKHLIA
ncbi:arginine ABC transporter periplasmic arginine-binding protein ArtI [Vibrio ponticus]|nr:arginine ABC transporter periplasmic arginine-binding protein ArtI [Vibrio ponticus]